MAEQVAAALERLEEHAGKQLGDDDDPLLVSVRSGARESMPGMLDTVLNLGLNDESVEGLAKATENERFAWDSYRRFVQMFGNVARGIPGEAFEDAITEVKAGSRRRGGHRARRRRAEGADERSRRLQGAHRRRLPAGPAGAAALRRSAPCSTPGPATARSSTGASTASPTSGAPRSTSSRWCSATRATRAATGVAFSRDEVTGAPEPSRRLPRQRPGRGRRLRRAQHARHRRAEGRHARGARAADGDPAHAREALQGHAGHRVHGRGGAALHAPDAQRQAPGAGRGALRVRRRRRGAAHAASRRCTTIDAGALDALLHPTFDPKADFEVLATGVSASPGAAKGEIVFTAAGRGRGRSRTGAT